MPMAEKITMPNSKKRFLIALIAVIGAIGYYAYLFINTTITQRLVISEQKKVERMKNELAQYSAIPGFDKISFVKVLEEDNYQMPWSDHIDAVTKIFDEVLQVDGDNSYNIILSDFEISLDAIKVHGYVTNLRLLYYAPEGKNSLIEAFKQLEFLDEISIKTYEKADSFGYNFVLSAKVINQYGTK